jgi:nucleotide-binding universal stress UspA family protein
MSMKNITHFDGPKMVLVPLDFSEHSRRALDCAISLAQPFNATIHLLHVVEALVFPPDVEVVDSAALAAQLNEEAAKSLEKWSKEASSRAVIEEDLRAGTPYREIIDAADETKADLIIMGTQGRTGLTRLLIGSTAERVVRHAHCPVLVVRERNPQTRKKRPIRPKQVSRARSDQEFQIGDSWVF